MNKTEIKRYIWNLMGKKIQKKYRCYKLRRSDQYIRLKKSVKKKRIFLLDTPEHGNLGDHAIAVAMKKFLRQYFPERELYEFSFSDCKYCLEEIYILTTLEDIIILPGGGFLGTLWSEEEENVLHIWNLFFRHKIVMFPQTLFFERSENGKHEKERFCEMLNKCENLSLFLRDQRSYELAQKLGKSSSVHFFLVPDIVLWLKNVIPARSRADKILVCMRDDKEKISATGGLEKYWLELERRGFKVEDISTVLERDISKETREKEVAQKLEQFAGARLVITDRLHGMIFSAITSTPCIAMDNLSQKISGGYEWIKYLDYIKLVREKELSMVMIEQMLSLGHKEYHNKQLEKYYGIIKETIAKES